MIRVMTAATFEAWVLSYVPKRNIKTKIQLDTAVSWLS